MKHLFLINLLMVMTTGISYINPIIGMISFLILGVFQIICFLFILFNWNKISEAIKNFLLVYFTLSALILTVLFSTYSFFYIVFITSGLLAFFFLFITYKIKQPYS